ncbi:MAG: hypothetical protein ACFFC7_13870 [Candidatus Hermodarchaeota archaeon]
MSRASNLARYIAETKKEIDRDSNSLDSELERSRKTLTRIKTDFEKKQETNKVTLSELITSLANNLEGLMKHLEAEKNERLAKGLSNIEQQLNEALTHTKQLYDDVQEELKSKNTTYFQEAEEKYNVKAQGFKENLTKVLPSQEKQVESLRKILTENISGMQTKISDIVESEVEKQKNTALNLKETLKESFDNFITTATSTIKEEDSQTKAIFDEGKNNLETLVNSASGKLSEVMNNAISSAQGSLGATKDEIQQGLENFRAKAEEIKENQKTNTDNLEKEFKEELANFRATETENFQKLLEDSNATLQDKLELNKDNMDDLILKTRTKLREDLYKELDEVASAFTNFYDTFLGQITNTIARLQQSSKEMHDSLNEILIQRLDRMQQLGARFEKLLEETFSHAQDIHRKESTATLDTYKGGVDSEYSKISSKFEEFEQNLAKSIEVNFSNHRNTLEEFNTQLAKTTTELITSTDKETHKTQDQIANDLNEFTTQQKTAFEDNMKAFNASLESKKGQVSEKITYIPQLVNELTKKHSEEITEKMASIIDDIEKMHANTRDTTSNIEKETLFVTNQQFDESIIQAKNLDQENQQNLTEFLEQAFSDYKELVTSYSTDLGTKFSESVGKVQDIEKAVFIDVKALFDKHILLVTNFVEDGLKIVQGTKDFKTEFEENSANAAKDTMDEVEKFYQKYFDLGKSVAGKAKQITRNADQIIREVK